MAFNLVVGRIIDHSKNLRVIAVRPNLNVFRHSCTDFDEILLECSLVRVQTQRTYQYAPPPLKYRLQICL